MKQWVWVFFFVWCAAASAADSEIHWSVCEKTPEIVLKKLGSPSFEKKAPRQVSYYDSRDLVHFRNGMIFRVRIKENGDAESVVKLRPAVPSRIDERWFDEKGFKCEDDLYGERVTSSCSLEEDVKAKPGDAPSEFFTRDQIEFLTEYGPNAPDPASFRQFGPVRSDVWKFELPNLSEPLKLETLRPPNGPILLELSTRSDSRARAAVYKKLTTLFSAAGITLCPTQESKTRQVLEYFSKRGR